VQGEAELNPGSVAGAHIELSSDDDFGIFLAPNNDRMIGSAQGVHGSPLTLNLISRAGRREQFGGARGAGAAYHGQPRRAWATCSQLPPRMGGWAPTAPLRVQPWPLNRSMIMCTLRRGRRDGNS
jgi:hypothetical protein